MEGSIASYTELRQLAESRNLKYLYFGAGDTLIKTRKFLYDTSTDSLLLDNNTTLRDVSSAETDNLRSHLPGDVSISSSDYLAIVTCSSYREVGLQLQSIGFTWGQNLFLSPYFEQLKHTSERLLKHSKFLVSSGYPSESVGGGGLYLVEDLPSGVSISRLLTGQVQSHLLLHSQQVLTSSNNGLQLSQFNEDFKSFTHSETVFSPPHKGARIHGISYDPDSGQTAVAASHNDAIYILDHHYQLVRTVSISNSATSTSETSSHHINDLYMKGDYIYFTCFSLSGLWKQGSYDGVLQAYHLPTNTSYVLMRDLYMPHNVVSSQGTLWVCDSMRSSLKSPDHQTMGPFPGFLRGLDTPEKDLYILGISGNRNRTRSLSQTEISYLSAGIVIFDASISSARIITLPKSVPGLHAVSTLPDHA